MSHFLKLAARRPKRRTGEHWQRTQVPGPEADDSRPLRPLRRRIEMFRRIQDTAMADRAKPRILVVEDDVDLRKILRLQLSSSGYEVIEAENGAVGFERVQQDDPDCVILDLMMPVLDGFGFLKRVRCVSAHEALPVLMLTASEDERHRTRSYQFQADVYMNKPYDLEELTEKIGELLISPTPSA